MAEVFAVGVRTSNRGRRRFVGHTGNGNKMQSRRHSWLRWCMLLAVLLAVPDFIAALKDVSVTIPQAVKRGSNALLICNYDMENDTLYSVKWYKGRREFYRYTPKENPAMKVFPMATGLNVERNLSNQSHVVLLAVPLNISGKFTCEISVEAPTFQTAMVSGEMEVVELPEQQAIVTGIQPRYRIGDLVDGNCSIKFSKPAANLTWTINGIVVPPHHIKTYQIEKYEDNNLESVVSAIHFMVTTQHFIKGQMRLKCTASIFDIFKEEIESIIEEDRPRIMASGRSYDMNNYPYEQHSSGDGFEDHNESYLTYYSAADITSAAATAAPMQPLQKRWLRIWTRFICALTTKTDYMLLTATTATASATATLQQYVKGSHVVDMDYDSSNTISGNVIVGVFVVAVVVVCAAVSVIRLTRHFISCQNCKKAKAALNVATHQQQQQQQQPSMLQPTTAAATLALAGTANGAAKRKSLHNCSVKNAKSLMPSKGLLAASKPTTTTTMAQALATNPLQKLQQQHSRSGKEARCHSVTNQNGCNIVSAAAASSTGRAHCRQLSVSHAGCVGNTCANALQTHNSNSSVQQCNKAIGNFVKDVSKDQTLLMMISLGAISTTTSTLGHRVAARTPAATATSTNPQC